MATKKPLAIIGNGMAANRLLDDLIQRGALERYAITVYGEERSGCYNRIMLSKVLAGADSGAIMLKPSGWYDDSEVRFVSAAPVTRLGPSARLIYTADDLAHHYALAVLATGSTPAVPGMEGLTQPDGSWKHGLFVYRTLDDCIRIRSRAHPGDNAVVLGGGLLGLEAAKALSDLGLHVTVVHRPPDLMNAQLDTHGAEMLRRQVERCGIFVRTGRSTEAVLGTDSVEGVVLDDGTTLAADMLVLACGIRPRVEVARASGIPVNRGVLVNDVLATQVPGVYAVGECAEHAGKVYGIVAPIWEQATVLADVLTGANPQARYRGSKLYTRLKVAGIEVASMGLIEPALETDEVLQVIEDRKSTYRKLIIREGRLVGAMLVGDAAAAATLVQLFDRGDPMPPNPLDVLCSPEAAGAGATSDRTICNCNKVSESAIVGAIKAGSCSLDALGESTRAGTGCGSCRGLLTQLIYRHGDPSKGEAHPGKNGAALVGSSGNRG